MIKTCYVDLDVLIKNKTDLLKYASSECYKAGLIDNEDDFYNSLLKREEEITTAIGKQIAIPHAIGSFVKESFVYFIRLKHPIDFNAIDKENVRLFFVIGTAEDKKDKHLKVLSRIAKLLLSEDKKFIFFNNRDAVYLKSELEKIFCPNILVVDCNFVFIEKIKKEFDKCLILNFKEKSDGITLFDLHDYDYVLSFSDDDLFESKIKVSDYEDLYNNIKKIKEDKNEN